MEGIGKGIGFVMILLCVVSVLIFWGGYELVDWIFVDDSIRSSEPITPAIELIIRDNTADTIYVYSKQ